MTPDPQQLPRATPERGQVRLAHVLAAAATPLVLALIRVLLHQAPLYFLGVGAALSLAMVLLARLLTGFAPFGKGRLQLGRPRRLRLWQAPVLWLAALTVACLLLFWRFAP